MLNTLNLKTVISGIFILILGIIIVLLATEVWSPLWNPFGPPDLVIEKAIAKAIAAETFKMDGKIEGEFISEEEGKPRSLTLTLFLSQIVDISDTEEKKSSADFDLRIGMEGVILQVKGELKSFGQDVYLKITSLPDLSLLGIGLEEIKDQWFKIDMEKIREMSGEESKEALTEDEKAFLQDLKEILKGKEIFKIEKDFGQEELDGEKVIHYSTKVKKGTVKVLIPEIFQLMKKYVPEEEKVSYERELEKFLEDFSQNFDIAWSNIEPLQFDFWLDERTNCLRRIKFEKKMEYAQPEGIGSGAMKSEETGAGEKVQIKLGVDLKLSDFNKEFEIETPTDFKSIEEFLSSPEFLQDFYGEELSPEGYEEYFGEEFGEEYYPPDFDIESLPEIEEPSE